MITTNLKIAFRRVVKNKSISFISISGLTIGLTCSILLASWVLHELSYDKFMKDYNNIYRVTLEGMFNGKFVNSSGCPGGIGPEASRIFPEVKSFTRFVLVKDVIIKTENRNSFRESGYAADSTFFHIFSFKAKLGDLSKSLINKSNIVIDEYLALKCFGKENSIGKNLFIDGQPYTISAVVENIPSNSHLQFHFLSPIINVGWFQRDQWSGDNSFTYLKLTENAGIHEINKKITSLVYQKAVMWKDLKVNFKLQPLKDIHFSEYKFDSAKTGDIKYVYIFGITAFLVLLIACINFTNLFIASAFKRRHEVGIKISNGASKFLILKEYIVEVFLYVFVSFITAIVLIKFISPYFNILAGQDIKINFLSTHFLTIAFSTILLTIILASGFPWFYIKNLKPISILKNKISSNSNKFSLLKSLVILQFTIAIILIFNLLIINKQINFMRSKNLGFDKENILYIYTNGILQKKEEQQKLKTELLKNANISAIAYESSIPTEWSNGSLVSKYPTKQNIISSEQVFVDEDYFDLMKIKFIEGGNIFKYSHDSLNYCIINKQLTKALGLTPPFVDKVIYQSLETNRPLIIKGVIEDVNTKSLKQQVDACWYASPWWRSNNAILLFKINRNYAEAIKAIREYCLKVTPDIPFEYHFLDDTYDKLYKSETNAKKIISWLTLLAIIITALGLLAMIMFITESKTKEIGVRRVNGARVTEILAMLNKDFIKWVAIAFLLACPIAWYAMHQWLQNFAYKTELSWWVFALAGIVAVAVAVLTVSWQSWRAATRNPVESLRYE